MSIVVKYGNKDIINGVFLTPLQTANQPSVTYTDANTSNNGLYTLIMYDSNAVSETKNHNHWIVINIPSNQLQIGSLTNCDTLLPYNGPAPPSGSGEHIYTFELYKQNDNLAKTAMTSNDRIISLNDIKRKIGVQNLTPISSVYFISEHQNIGGKNRNSKKNSKKNSKSKTYKKHSKQHGGKWSLKYKKSINCNRPKGFSQKQHCKYGRNK
jgi:phosphatidylethanolamine-binding protein (PEBP) family uncharacterized protein